MATDIDRCTQVYRTIPGLGPVARFDPLSPDTACKQLYAGGNAATRDVLVQRFCNQFPASNIPGRCQCYRFKETEDYKRYSSLWADMLADNTPGLAGDPLAGSFVCFAPSCAADPDSYKTSDMQATLTHGGCPSVVYCKQQVGDLSIKTEGRSLADITVDIKQKCGTKAHAEPNTEDGTNEGANAGNEDGTDHAGTDRFSQMMQSLLSFLERWQQAMLAVLVLLLIIILFLIMSRRRVQPVV